jgi:hypothetical protein
MYSGFSYAKFIKDFYNDFYREMYVEIFNSEIISELANTTVTALPGMYTTDCL